VEERLSFCKAIGKESNVGGDTGSVNGKDDGGGAVAGGLLTHNTLLALVSVLKRLLVTASS